MASEVIISLPKVKRRRVADEEKQPSVKVTYKSLTKDSERKLKELLQQWSQWHAQHGSSSPDSGKALESGEVTFFPATLVGLDKTSAVPFWMENEIEGNKLNKEFTKLGENSIPVYDRAFSIALSSTDDGSSNLGRLGVEESFRCFNCGSYNHSLKECPKPRDKLAVAKARKNLASRNKNSSSRNLIRYYETSLGGKYDGLQPGTLDSKTRQLLGLGELDPPPWLNRMREIGYPPGYLLSKDDEQPSGITIFGEDENACVLDIEEGEIIEMAEPDKRMSVEFPGVNAPIPDNANKMRWEATPSDLSLYRNCSYDTYSRTSDFSSRKQHHYRGRPV